MSKLISLRRTKGPKKKQLFFSKIELGKILSIYSNGVVRGHWRDYAIDQNGTTSIFFIYRNSRENPTFALTKRSQTSGLLFNFGLLYGSKAIETSNSLDIVLKRLTSLPKIVKI